MSARVLKDKASKLLAKGQLERAEVVFRQVLTQAPRDSQTWLKHAEVLKRLGRTRDAVGSYRLAARVLDEEGHHPRAAAALKLALALMPDDVDLIADIIRSEMKALKPGEGVRTLFPMSSPSQLLAVASDTPFSSSSSSVEVPLLALPMASETERASNAQSRIDTWTPDEAPVITESAEPAQESSPALDDLPPEVMQAQPVSADQPSEELPVEVMQTESWPQVRRLSDHRLAIRTGPDAKWILVESESPLSVSFADSVDVPDDAMWLE